MPPARRRRRWWRPSWATRRRCCRCPSAARASTACKGLAIGVPAYVGEHGVAGILQLRLSAADREAFDQAAAALKAAHDSIVAGAA